MAFFGGILLITFLAQGSAESSQVTPVQKVIELVEKMKSETEKEGMEESKTYSKFACFCKNTTETKSKALVDGDDKSAQLSAIVADQNAKKEKAIAEVATRKADQEKHIADKEQSDAQFQADEAAYKAASTDTGNAINALTQAIESMETSVALVQGAHGIPTSVVRIVAMADAMGMVKSQHKAVSALLKEKGKSAFLQKADVAVEPGDAAYKNHNTAIVSLCKDLKGQFEQRQKDETAEFNKLKETYIETQKTLTKQIADNNKAIQTLGKDIESYMGAMSGALKNLEQTRVGLEEDKLYLKDLTKKCEDSANDWDQRTSLRADEINVLKEALTILMGVVTKTDIVNERALLQKRAKPHENANKKMAPHKKMAPLNKMAPLKKMAPHKKMAHYKKMVIDKKMAHHMKMAHHNEKSHWHYQPRNHGWIFSYAPYFLQSASEAKSVKNVIRHQEVLSAEQRKDLAQKTLQREGQRLHSMALQALSVHVGADPFAKVKGLIEKVIERLVAEATAEAEKKGFCDTEMAKAKKEREYRFADVMKMNAEVAELEATRDEMKLEIKELTGDLATLDEALENATKIRAAEKTDNLNTLKLAKEGLAAMEECIEALETFYRVSKRATALVQVSPVDEDTEGAGFTGAYKGQQTRSVAVLELLQHMKDDYERTIKTTTADEAEANADFIEFKKTSMADISGKTTKKTMDEEDLASAEASIKSNMDDLTTNQAALDSALQTLVKLNPMCVDSGMSNAERVAKREGEIKALNDALCHLDTEGVEKDCEKLD